MEKGGLVAKILVVHPDLVERVILSIQLESQGFSPAAVGSASRALDRLATSHVDLVLSDCATLLTLGGDLGAVPAIALAPERGSPKLYDTARVLRATTMLRLPVRSELLADVIRFTLADPAVRPA
jgi:CheY-like chemotaxis protein